MEVGIDEAWKNGPSVTREDLRARRDERVQIPFCSDGQNLSGRNRHRFGNWLGWVESEDPPSVEEKVGSGRGDFFLPLPKRERVGVRVFRSHIATPRALTLALSQRERETMQQES